jgi:DNA-binding NtrC family response regulator
MDNSRPKSELRVDKSAPPRKSTMLLYCEVCGGIIPASHFAEGRATMAAGAPICSKCQQRAGDQSRTLSRQFSAAATSAVAARLVGRSSAILAVRDSIARFSAMDMPVLITGETGTGKELVARAIHDAGLRAARPFIVVNCGAVPESLLEVELFGRERGSNSENVRARRGIFETAGRGTVFLDDVAEMSARLQLALLRVLETREVRPVGGSHSKHIACRIVAATNADPEKLAEDGTFRKDLLFRLRRLSIHLPPLRSRPEDIVPVGQYFLEQGGRPGQTAMSAELRDALTRYQWPGNVRELKNVVDQMRVLHPEKSFYGLEDLDTDFMALNRRGRNGDAADPAREESPRRKGSTARAKSGARAMPDSEQIDNLLQQGKTKLRRQARLRDLFLRYETLTRSEIVKILGISAPTVTQDLKGLLRDGFIQKIEPSASPRSHYFILKAPKAKPDVQSDVNGN